MIRPRCDRCKLELQAPGGLAFSPPQGVASHAPVEKYHICAACWSAFLVWLESSGVKGSKE